MRVASAGAVDAHKYGCSFIAVIGAGDCQVANENGCDFVTRHAQVCPPDSLAQNFSSAFLRQTPLLSFSYGNNVCCKWTMPVTFGSVGDIVAVCLIIKDLVDALDKSRGSSAEYQQIIRELWTLDRVLLQVIQLSESYRDCIEFHVLGITVVQAVENCRRSMNDFLGKVRKYERSLRDQGSGNFLKDSARKLQWQVFKREEMEKFRFEIMSQSSFINISIATAEANMLRINDKKLQNRLDQEQARVAKAEDKHTQSLFELKAIGTENNRLTAQVSNQLKDLLQLKWPRKLASDIYAIVQKTYRMNVTIYSTVMSIKSLLPSYLERGLIDEPFILEDAIGRHTPVHLQFISSWEAFESVLEHRFRDTSGYQRVLDRQWALQELTTHRDIKRTTPWDKAVFPGQRIGMDMIFRETMGSGNVDITKCGICGAASDEKSRHHIFCLQCGSNRTIVELKDDEVEGNTNDSIKCKSGKISSASESLPQDDARSFKRVRFLISQAPQSRKSKAPDLHSNEENLPERTASTQVRTQANNQRNGVGGNQWLNSALSNGAQSGSNSNIKWNWVWKCSDCHDEGMSTKVDHCPFCGHRRCDDCEVTALLRRPMVY
ncbi:hypothetical protein B0O99DRAFT_689964 [Bisporella sp. PMI_857]|nr:hypothetical protein B0O99DRAFT_689964 [Bisporella sp. PMI_857]